MQARWHVSLLAIPDAGLGTLSGIYDVMNAFRILEPTMGVQPFRAEIVGEATGPLTLASGLTMNVQQSVDALTSTDIVIVPSLLLPAGDGWRRDRYPRLVEWLREVYGRGAVLCSACSGIFLLAETGIFDGHDATVHYDYARLFAATYPAVRIHSEQALVVAGRREELLSSGASTSWHDLVLYLIARFADVTAAQQVAHFFSLQWHQQGLAPYTVFDGRKDHGDAEIRSVQDWIATHLGVANPVEEMIERSNLRERTFNRRFTQATGHSPIAYVQRLRIEDAKRRLERTTAAAEEIAWQVGYADPAAFRRLFKRLTGVTPGTYRRMFRTPETARLS